MEKTSSSALIILKLLLVVFLFQSCTIYRARNAGIDKAVEVGSKVKVETKDNKIYKFKKLGRDENGLFGLAGRNSNTARSLAENIVDKNASGRFVKIGIDENSVEEVRLKNKTVSVLVPLIIGFALFLSLTAIILSSFLIVQ